MALQSHPYAMCPPYNLLYNFSAGLSDLYNRIVELAGTEVIHLNIWQTVTQPPVKIVVCEVRF